MEYLEDRVVLSSMSVANLNDRGDGSLRYAIEQANLTPGPDEIVFDASLKGTISLTSGALGISDEVSIHGPGKDVLTISGNGQSRVFDVNETSLAINQLTIADGHAVFDMAIPEFVGTDGGGAIRASNSDVLLEHVILENNHFEGGKKNVPAGGGAIQAALGSVTLDHVTARNNEAVDLYFVGIGGAVFTIGSSLEVTNSDFEGNRAALSGDSDNEAGGGAIGSRGLNIGGTSFGDTVVRQSRFHGNQADGGDRRGSGGAIRVQTGNSLTVDRSEFVGNSAVGKTAAGGAIATFQGVTSTISNSLMEQNSAVGDTAQGGAIWQYRGFGGTMEIDSSSIHNNQVQGTELAEGGGIYNGTDVGPPMLMTITNTHVMTNQAIGDGETARGTGGGVFNIQSIEIDQWSSIERNEATTSDGDVFGELTTIDVPLAADIDGNGSVEFTDFLLLSSHFDQNVEPGSNGDLDGDGEVGFSDFLLLSANFGRTAAAVDAAMANNDLLAP